MVHCRVHRRAMATTDMAGGERPQQRHQSRWRRPSVFINNEMDGCALGDVLALSTLFFWLVEEGGGIRGIG